MLVFFYWELVWLMDIDKLQIQSIIRYNSLKFE